MNSKHFDYLKPSYLLLFLTIILFSLNSNAQNNVGDWCGTIGTSSECTNCLAKGIMQVQPHTLPKPNLED